ncbi:unnamed protein product [Alternaria burnsii]|nr:unnamed protein product [Alternaria burnsii]
MSAKFRLFIDGLDEYDGDHEEVIQTICHLIKVGVKLCIASRPWNIFEEAFGSSRSLKLYLQDLNKKDIQLYADERLRKHRNIQRIEPAQVDEIINELIKKSQGVFLWERLAVRSLEEGLRNGDSLVLLRKRLNAFPSDLDEFFRHMFISLDTIYRTHLSYMFQIALTARAPLSTVAYWFLDEIDDDPNFAITMQPRTLEASKLFEITEEMTVRINGRSRCLLKVTKTMHIERRRRLTQETKRRVETHVDFLHWTIKDFIMTTEIQRLLAEWPQPSFHPDIALCKMMLAEFKSVAPTSRAAESRELVRSLMEQLFCSAQRIERIFNESPIAHIEEFDRVSHSCLFLGRTGEWDPLGCSSLEMVAQKYGLWIFLAMRTKQGLSTGTRELIPGCNAGENSTREEHDRFLTSTHEATSVG